MKKVFWLILALVLLVLIVPGIINTIHNYHLEGSEHYDLRIANQVLDGSITGYDNLIFFDRPLLITPYHFVLAGFLFVFGMFGKVLLPFLLGVGSFLLMYLIARKFVPNKFSRLLFFVVLLLSPPFIHLFSTINIHALNVFLLLLGFFILMRNTKTLSLVLAGACFYLVTYTSVYFLALIWLVLVFYLINRKEERKKLLLLGIFLTVATFVYNLGFFSYVLEYNYFNTLIFDFGNILGFSIFALLLFLLNLFLDWKNKKKHKEAYALFGFFVISGIFLGPVVNYYFVIVIAYFAGSGFYKVLRRKWELSQIKTLALIVLLCGLLLSTSTMFSELGKREIFDTAPLEALNDGVVLTSVENGFMVQTVTGLPVLLDDYSYQLFGFNGVKQDYETMLTSRNYYDTLKLLKKYNVKGILITEDMKDELWGNREEGLVFLFRNSETFKNLYSGQKLEVWQVNHDVR